MIENQSSIRGCVMVGVQGLELTPEEQQMLLHPLTAGVIFFSRNFTSVTQFQQLTQQIRQLRPELLLAVDHEGGRVQRFRHGLHQLPPLAQFGRWYEQNADFAVNAARFCGWLSSVELRALDLDINFAPTLDLDYGRCAAIGDRAAHRDSEIVQAITSAFWQGMQLAGLTGVAKHFPGHGFVEGDSHQLTPTDDRSLEELSDDLEAYDDLLAQGVAAILPAHIIYPAVDAAFTAGFSRIWLQDILREQLQFEGAIISDDLDMQGAGIAGGALARAEAALAAGVDLLLCCNKTEGMWQVLHGLSFTPTAEQLQRLETLRAQPVKPVAHTVLAEADQLFQQLDQQPIVELSEFCNHVASSNSNYGKND